MSLFLSLLFYIAILLTNTFSAPTSSTAPSATVDSGVVIGKATTLRASDITVNQFLGIPFAASPTRFAPPVPPAPWTSPYQATNYGPACPQQFNYPEAARNATIAFANTPPPPAGESEDCLNLNIYVPNTPGKGKVVMVWIYGGALMIGANSLPIYNGTNFAANQDVIIVTLNYRTNVFGFPSSSQLPPTERNLGFLDQRLALDWIQRNIAAFGGDPKKVTIFGESAGATSVDVLVTTYSTNPPFRAAIMQSGQSSSFLNQTNAPTSWTTLASAVNCSTTPDILACIRALPVSVIKSTIEHLALPFPPVTDNVTFLRYPEDARLRGDIARVPVLTGTNADEGNLIAAGLTNATRFLNNLLPNMTPILSTVLAAYPIGSPGINTPSAQIAAILTDYVFQCRAGIAANDSISPSLKPNGIGIPTWRYLFNATFPNTQLFPGSGAYHGSEIPIVFGTYPLTNITEGEMRMSEFLQSAWATFARNPNGGPGWGLVPEVAVLGGGLELRRMVSAGEIDTRCGLYRGLYEAIGIAPTAGPA